MAEKETNSCSTIGRGSPRNKGDAEVTQDPKKPNLSGNEPLEVFKPRRVLLLLLEVDVIGDEKGKCGVD